MRQARQSFVSVKMKAIKFAVLLMLLLGALVSGSVWADPGGHGGRGGWHGHGHGGWHGRSHVGIVIGAPLFWAPASPYYYPAPYPYYAPPVVAVPATPPVYIERGDEAASDEYWYFCSNPQGYYPYVKQCPPGWQQVTPQPRAGN